MSEVERGEKKDNGAINGPDDYVSRQLSRWQKEHPEVASIFARDQVGHTSSNLLSTLTIGNRGPIVMGDTQFLRSMQGFVRERLPSRVMGDKGCGARGYFEAEQDVSNITKIKAFAQGTRTKVLVRFTTSKWKGEPDVCRVTVKGASIKFYTEDGNLDFVCSHLPVYHWNDGLLTPFFNASLYNPQTNIPDETARFDFISSVPEHCHSFLHYQTDAGLPSTLRHMNFYAIHSFKFVNSSGEYCYGRLIFKSTLPPSYMTDEERDSNIMKNPDIYIRDLYNTLASKQEAKWKLVMQTMTEEETGQFKRKYGWNFFDVTKEWPTTDYPLRTIGTLCINENTENYFVEGEQAAFQPANLVPGIQPAYQDRLLATRILAYTDAQMYRLGSNNGLLPVNQPIGLKEEYRTYFRDGVANGDTIQNGAPNYFPNSFGGPKEAGDGKYEAPQKVSGKVGYYDYNAENKTDWYGQATALWEKLVQDEKKRVVKRIHECLHKAIPEVQNRFVNRYGNVSKELEKMLRQSLNMTGS